MGTIKVVTGIGDIFWILQKINGIEAHLEICQDETKRGIQLFDMIKHNFKSVSYGRFTTNQAIKRSAFNTTFKQVEYQVENDHEVYLCANRWLDAGNRIEDYMPDREMQSITFKLNDPFATKDDIIIYTSSSTNTRRAGLWQWTEWVEFMNLFPTTQKFYIVGAKYDLDLISEIKLRTAGKYPIEIKVDNPLERVIASCVNAKCFISRASGLGILTEAAGGKVHMMYPAHEIELMQAWPTPNNQNYIGTIWESPKEVHKQIKKRGWI